MATQKKHSPRSKLEGKENNILNAATELFADIGFQASSTRKIAAAAGVSEGTLFHYFRTKNELLIAIVEGFYENLILSTENGIRDIMGTKERLEFIATNHIQALAADNALFLRLLHVFFNSDLHIYERLGDSDIHKLNLRFVRVFDATVKEGIQRGTIRGDVDLSTIRDLFFGGLEYRMRTFFIQKGSDINSYGKDIINSIWPSLEDLSISTTVTTNTSSSSNADQLEKRLKKVCARLEAVAEKFDNQ